MNDYNRLEIAETGERLFNSLCDAVGQEHATLIKEILDEYIGDHIRVAKNELREEFKEMISDRDEDLPGSRF